MYSRGTRNDKSCQNQVGKNNADVHFHQGKANFLKVGNA